jgi:metallo-beta-lactamase family protein
VSYQAPGTTGRRLTEQKPTIRFQGREWNKWIEVVHLNGFSGHADKNDFLAYLEPLAGKVGKVRLIHGEHEQADAMAVNLLKMGFTDVRVPESGEKVILGD